MRLSDEKRRLREDYPHLTPEFEKRPDHWECELFTETRLFGYYGVQSGIGRSRVEALLNARKRIDDRVAAETSRLEAERRVEHELLERERALDDAMFSSI